MPITVSNLFKSDLQGMAKPELFPGSEWAKLNGSLMTIKLDSIAVEVGWDQKGTCWTIHRLHSNGLPDERLFRNSPSGGAVWEAFDSMPTRKMGKYLVYGAAINGNPHRLSKTLMASFMPITHQLVVQEHKTIVCRGEDVSPAAFFNAIKQELEESPEIEGFVFHREDEKLNVTGMAKVTRQQMGLVWPVPKPERVPVTSLVM